MDEGSGGILGNPDVSYNAKNKPGFYDGKKGDVK